LNKTKTLSGGCLLQNNPHFLRQKPPPDSVFGIVAFYWQGFKNAIGRHHFKKSLSKQPPAIDFFVVEKTTF